METNHSRLNVYPSVHSRKTDNQLPCHARVSKACAGCSIHNEDGANDEALRYV